MGYEHPATCLRRAAGKVIRMKCSSVGGAARTFASRIPWAVGSYVLPVIGHSEDGVRSLDAKVSGR